MSSCLHPGRLTWNLQITHLERKMIFQTSMIMVHVNLRGCTFNHHFQPSTTARSARFWRSGCLWCTFQWGHHFDTTWRSQSWKKNMGRNSLPNVEDSFFGSYGFGEVVVSRNIFAVEMRTSQHQSWFFQVTFVNLWREQSWHEILNLPLMLVDFLLINITNDHPAATEQLYVF